MTLRAESRMERLLHQGAFCVTAEAVPPRSADPDAVTAQARGLVGYADAVNVTDAWYLVLGAALLGLDGQDGVSRLLDYAESAALPDRPVKGRHTVD